MAGSIYVAGLDLGQTTDYTALVIVQAQGVTRMVECTDYDRETHLPFTRQLPLQTMPLAQLDVRHVERFPLNTKYQTIANEMGRRIVKIPSPRYFAIDQTGVGMGVIEMMQGLSPIGITITGGNEVVNVGAQSYRVPKRDLISGAQIALQNHVLRIAKGLPHAELLTREMQNFRVKISAGGHDSYEAWRENEHDDLVLALAIATWTAQLIISINTQLAAENLTGRSRGREGFYQISPY